MQEISQRRISTRLASRRSRSRPTHAYKWGQLQDSINPDLPSHLKILVTNNNEALFQLRHAPVGGRMLLNHLKYYQGIAGRDTCGHFPGGGLRCITWNSRGLVGSVFSSQKNREFKLKYFRKLVNNNILCLHEVHGRVEYLQAIQVLAPRFRFFVTFITGNEYAGRSAICIHKELLPEDAIEAHMITCQDRDHVVSIQSGRQSPVLVKVHFEAELTLRRLRERLHLINPHWSSYPNAEGILLGDSNICDPEEGRFRHEIFTATPKSSRTWETGPFRVTTRRYVLSFISHLIGSNRANAFQAGCPNILSSVLF